MTDRFDWLYPFLLAVVPVLHLAASHPGQTSLDDLAVIIVVILAGCVLVYAGASAVGSQRRRLASLATLIAVMWFYGYAKVANNINEWLEGHYHYLIIPVGLVLTAVLCQALLRRPKQLDRVARFLTLVGVLLVAQFGVRIGAAQWRLRRELRDSKLISALAKPIGIRSGFAA